MTDTKPQLGWERIWVICYAASNGKYYPISTMFFPLRILAEEARKQYPKDIARGYKVLPYWRPK